MLIHINKNTYRSIHFEFFQIMHVYSWNCFHKHNPTGYTPSIETTYMTETPSIQSTAVEVDDTKYIIAFCVSGGFFLMLVVLVTTALLLLSRRLQQNRGTYSSYLKVLTVELPQMMSQSQIIFLLMITLLTLPWRELIWTRTLLMRQFIWDFTSHINHVMLS